ncbi:RpiB/LacA/LacB family sugar-phosphate isomerase [Streptomyces sp. NPDC058471]|uniref:RpiB/LacA/LacB family sugar-phosphate isomerase n=1 Tax=Streptomyces sp. NPDC058471 TaxID=3346516 RepID=UPI003655DA3F
MPDDLRIAVGGDRAGAAYATALAGHTAAHPRVGAVITVGLDEDRLPYPDVAFAAAQLIATGHADRALLACHTGLGMAIAANKISDIRAATAHDPLSVQHAVTHNNAQIWCLGAGVIDLALARWLADQWLGHTFDPASRAATKLALIAAHEQRHLHPAPC